MIGKNEKLENEETNETRVNVISEKRKLLQDTSAKIQEEVRLCFEQLAKVLRTREKQLLRQVQAVHNQQLSLIRSDCNFAVPAIPAISVDLSRRRDVERSIFDFGELLSSDGNSIVVGDAEPYKIEEYVEANRDHISFDKSIKIDDPSETAEHVERFDASLNSSGELSLDASSEADFASENDITVLQNHNYSSSSDGLRDNVDSPKSFGADEKNEDERSIDTLINFANDASKCGEEASKRSEKTELTVLDEIFRNNEDCAVPETENKSFEKKFDDTTKENDRNSTANVENKSLRPSTDFESGEEASEAGVANKKAQDCEQHPKQIQQWLQQILVETETEPTIHEVEQFAEISKSRFKELQFPLET